MPYTAIAVLIAAAIISLTLRRGFRQMSETITQATDELTAEVAKIVTDVSAGLTDIANSIGEHIANGTATTAILAQVDKLKALDTSVLAAEAPAGDDTVAAGTDDDTVAAPSGDDTISGS